MILLYLYYIHTLILYTDTYTHTVLIHTIHLICTGATLDRNGLRPSRYYIVYTIYIQYTLYI